MSNLTKVWAEVETLLADGISLIPVRDKQDGDKAPKTPYNLWKQFQSRKATKEELWHEMEAKNTTAIAIVCGKISGSLEVIDVDVKYKEGIAGTLFSLLQKSYPALFEKIRIHNTPSKGYHLLYRIANAPDAFPGNMKLAGRYATEAELVLNPKVKQYNFLETRGEAGYILAPPSLDYSVHQDVEIPLISWEDRCNIINICRSLTEIIEIKAIVKATKSQSDYYSENPFDDYNHRGDLPALLNEYDWRQCQSHSSKYLYFTRPGKKNGVSGSFHAEHRVFWSFTVSSEFDELKGYKPVDVLLKLKFDGDTKKLYRYLVDEGFGVVKHKVEQQVVKRAAMANKLLPANFSTEAHAEYILQVEKLKEDYPFGYFIKYDSDADKLSVSYEMLLHVAKELGLYTFEGSIAYVSGYIVERISDRRFQDILKDYIREEDADDYEHLCNIFEKFLKENTKFITTRLPILSPELLCVDSKNECYKFFNNGYLLITDSSIEFNDYSQFPMLVWADRIQPRDYIKQDGGRFVEYLNLALVNPAAAMPVLGFLSHEFKDETTGYIIVLTEACKDPKMGGGSGKNVFCNLLKLTTTYISKPGGQGKFDEKFFQVWNDQKVFGVSDLPKNFDFKAFKEPATGSFVQKKLYKDEIEVPVEKTPKFIMQTNYSFTDSDGGLIRRIIALEFTDFFTKCGGLDMHFGVHFPKGWTKDDYAGYDNYIAECIQVWMIAGCKLKPTELTEEGWLKKFELNYGEVASGFIVECFNDIIKKGEITNDDFKKLIASYYQENNIPKHYEAKYKSISDGLRQFCDKHGIDIKTDQTIRTSQVSTAKGRKFKAVSESGQLIIDNAKNEKDEEIPF